MFRCNNNNFVRFNIFQVASEQITATSFLSFIIQIGKIESINLQSDSASTCGPVIFRQPEHAAQLLRQQHLICAGADIRIWEAIGQPTHGTNILDLNDHCLRKVFSNLYVKDLASVAEVNQRFKVNAQAIRTPNGISCRKKCRALFPPSDA